MKMMLIVSVGVDEVARTVRAELGAEISELFREFDEEAIAAASLAQVRLRIGAVIAFFGVAVGWLVL